ncbi:Carbohydrate esterase 4 protein [Allomyces javanicus]|nr:Carbohydrate esterase 4 protein [Allomyces javanicus]
MLVRAVVALALILAIVRADYAPSAAWCVTPKGSCPTPASKALDSWKMAEADTLGDTPDAVLTTNANASLPAGYSGCGDGVCAILSGETCGTCPADCGACAYGAVPIQRCVQNNMFALTFDDGPSYSTEQAVQILNSNNVTGTFFVNAIHALEKPSFAASMRAAAASGHIIGTHTYNHRSVVNGHAEGLPATNLSIGTLRTVMYFNDMVVYENIGKLPRFFRPPYLETNAGILPTLDTWGYVPVGVSFDTTDWAQSTRTNLTDAQRAAAVIQQVTTMLAASPPGVTTAAAGVSLAGGAIHLQHDILGYSMNALQAVITALRARRDLQLVSLATCLGMSPYRSAQESPFFHNRFPGNKYPTILKSRAKGVLGNLYLYSTAANVTGLRKPPPGWDLPKKGEKSPNVDHRGDLLNGAAPRATAAAGYGAVMFALAMAVASMLATL